MYLISSVPLIYWSLGNQTRCSDLLFIIIKPSTTKWAYTDSGTLTYTVSRYTLGGGGGEGGILPCKLTNRVGIAINLITNCIQKQNKKLFRLCCFQSYLSLIYLYLLFFSLFFPFLVVGSLTKVQGHSSVRKLSRKLYFSVKVFSHKLQICMIVKYMNKIIQMILFLIDISFVGTEVNRFVLYLNRSLNVDCWSLSFIVSVSQQHREGESAIFILSACFGLTKFMNSSAKISEKSSIYSFTGWLKKNHGHGTTEMGSI